MDSKKIILHDSIVKTSDSINNKMIQRTKFNTEISMYIHGESIPIWTRHNMITVAGGAFTARCHFGLSNQEITPTYDSYLDGFKSVSSPDSTESSKICLFAVGIDGCGAEASQVKPVIYNSWIPPESLVPFKFGTEDIDTASQKLYSGHCNPSSGKHIYYFKTFDSAPVLVQKFLDGTVATTNNIYQNTSTEVQTYVECKLKLSSSDCRSFFGDNTASAKINTISLLSATPITKGGVQYYKDIRPVTKLNFPNESLADPEKGLDITYRIFY